MEKGFRQPVTVLGSDFPKLNVFRVPADGVFDDFDALDGMGEHCTAIGGIAAYQRIAAAVKGLNQRIFWEKAADFGCQLMSLLRRGPIASLTEFKEPRTSSMRAVRFAIASKVSSEFAAALSTRRRSPALSVRTFFSRSSTARASSSLPVVL